MDNFPYTFVIFMAKKIDFPLAYSHQFRLLCGSCILLIFSKSCISLTGSKPFEHK